MTSEDHQQHMLKENQRTYQLKHVKRNKKKNNKKMYNNSRSYKSFIKCKLRKFSCPGFLY